MGGGQLGLGPVEALKPPFVKSSPQPPAWDPTTSPLSPTATSHPEKVQEAASRTLVRRAGNGR